MKATTAILSAALVLLCISDINAQHRTSSREKGRITLQDIRDDIRLFTSPTTGKMKSSIDRGVSEMYYDSYSDDWVNTERNEYEYSSDRKTITIDHFNLYNQEQEFQYSYSTDITLDDEGRLLTLYAEFIENVYSSYEFFYDAEGKIDSLFSIDYEEGFSEVIEVRFSEITADSMMFEVTYISDGEVDEIETNYAVERDGNYIEYYVYPDWTDRYTYYNMSMSDIGALITDDLFLVEVYNDEFYPDDGWIPYSRSYFVEEEGVNTQLISEYFDLGEWFHDGGVEIGYDTEERINELTNYFDNGESIIYNERFRFVYEQSTSVDDLESDTPNRLVLHQNYPNPFNPSTNISYELMEASNVELKVFNILGKEIATLVNGKQSAGTHNVSFSAKNLPSGLYVYRLRAGTLYLSKSMMLIK